jgi:GR25 family glycosyltransferase involved in LPS biosynthesis
MSSYKLKREQLGLNSKKKEIKKCFYCFKIIGNRRACRACGLLQPKATIVAKRSKPRNIKRVFVLTLNGKESRIDLFKERTLQHLTEYECFPYIGVDGRDTSSVKKILEYFYANDTSYIYKIMGHREKHPGSIGCYLSHMSIWNYAYNSKKKDENYILILEDDATFEKHGIENIEITIDMLMYLDWDILYFGHSPKLKGSIIYPNILRPLQHSYPEKRTNCGFWGYAIKLSSVPQLIQSVRKFETMSIDATIQYYFGKIVKPLFLIKPLVKQSAGYSVRMMIEKDGLR